MPEKFLDGTDIRTMIEHVGRTAMAQHMGTETSFEAHSLAEFAELPGVGATKLDRYGQSFLDVIVRTLAQ